MYVKYATLKYESYQSLDWVRVAGGYMSGSLTLQDGRKRPIRMRVDQIIELVADPSDALRERDELIKSLRKGQANMRDEIDMLKTLLDLKPKERKPIKQRYVRGTLDGNVIKISPSGKIIPIYTFGERGKTVLKSARNLRGYKHMEENI